MDFDLENHITSAVPIVVTMEDPTETTTAAAMAQEIFRNDVDQAYKIGSDFSEYYYKIIATKPHKSGELYLENSVLLWDGHPSLGRQSIQCFFENLPAMTFNTTTLDCQTLHSMAVGTKKTYIINAAGRYLASGISVKRQFAQTIVITEDKGKWRIATDTFRTQAE